MNTILRILVNNLRHRANSNKNNNYYLAKFFILHESLFLSLLAKRCDLTPVITDRTNSSLESDQPYRKPVRGSQLVSERV